jgi:hypothetical protein
LEKNNISTEGKRPRKKVFLWLLASLVAIIVIASVCISVRLNQLVADALLKSFNSTAASDVYELKFDKLRVNFFRGNIRVMNVVIQPRQKPLHTYLYINSTFRLTTRNLLLENVQILTLFRTSKLRLIKIEIVKPDIQVQMAGERNIFIPFADSSAAAGKRIKDLKRFFDSYFLAELKLVDASFQLINKGKKREFLVDKLNISLTGLMLSQIPGRDLVSFKQVNLRIGEISGKMQNEAIRKVSIKNFSLNIDSLNIQNSIDTLIYHFVNFNTGMKNLDILTADSTFRIGAQSINISYPTKSVILAGLSFKPNISRASVQKRFRFQVPQFSGTIDTISILDINFDTLIYQNKLFVDEIDLTNVRTSVFKDKTKPLNQDNIPDYPGQLVKAIPFPVMIREIKAIGVNIDNVERKTDGNIARVKIQRGTIDIQNITNLPTDKMLTLIAHAYIENKAYFDLGLNFSYLKPQFSFSGKVGKFNIPDFNPFIQSYLPVSFNKGTNDDITFSGNAYRTNASGTMKFLYHDLNIEANLPDKPKWQNSVITFAANTFLNNANPPAAGRPARVVGFKADRDMNRGFINIILKSVFAGMKETLIISKGNKQAYKEARKAAK